MLQKSGIFALKKRANKRGGREDGDVRRGLGRVGCTSGTDVERGTDMMNTGGVDQLVGVVLLAHLGLAAQFVNCAHRSDTSGAATCGLPSALFHGYRGRPWRTAFATD